MRNRKDKSYYNETSIDYHRRSMTSIPITSMIAGKIENIDLSKRYMIQVKTSSEM